MKYDNTAGRMLQIMEQIRSHPDGKNVAEVWGRILDVDPNNYPAFFERFGQMHALYYAMERDIERLNHGNNEWLTKYFPRIKASLSIKNFDATWQHVRQNLDDVTIHSLEGCAYELFKAGISPSIPKKDLDAIRVEIEVLVESILQAELDPRFKVFLVKHLEALRHAILQYRLTGVEGLVEAVEQAFGAMYLRPDALEQVQKEPAGRNFFQILQRAGSMAKTAIDIAKIAEFALRHLPSLGDSAPGQFFLSSDDGSGVPPSV